MTYYKIILDAQIIGVATSVQCFRFQEKHSMLVRTSITNAEYIECEGKLYHAWWMKPIQTNMYPYQVAEIIEIEEQEYNILAPISEPIPVQEEDETPEIPVPAPVDPVEEITVDYIKTGMIAQMRADCRNVIEGGFDLELRDEMHHFSLSTQDQLNLISLGVMAQTQSLIPYHADGEEVIFYTDEEINEIVDTANAFKIYHTTYYNALKTYINSLDTIEALAEVYYGMEIPEEFKSDVLKALEQ